MKYNNQEVINCIYGNYGSYKIINFDPENNFEANVLLTNDASYEDGLYFLKQLLYLEILKQFIVFVMIYLLPLNA